LADAKTMYRDKPIVAVRIHQMIDRPERIFLATGALMAIALLWLAADSVVWDARLLAGFSHSGWHYLAHFAVFALFAVVWMLGLPGINALYVALAIVIFGFAHEAIEIAGHAHAFELADACVDAAGATLGVAWARNSRWRDRRVRTAI